MGGGNYMGGGGDVRLFKRWNTLRCFIQFNSEYISNPLFVISYLLNTLHGGRENWSSVGENGGGVHNKKGGWVLPKILQNGGGGVLIKWNW